MAQTTWWWLAAGIAVAVELGTGTFYLLMVAVGLAAGAIAGHAGASPAGQLVAAALVGGGAVAGLHLQRRGRQRPAVAHANPDVNPDIGETIHVQRWEEDGTASVHYRGARWTALPAPGVPREAGTYRIREVIGNRLVIEKAAQVE